MNVVAVDRRALVLDSSTRSLTERVRSQDTLNGVMDATAVIAFGRDGELSTPQRGLVATVVAVMQDKVIDAVNEQNRLLHEQLIEQRRVTSEVIKGVAISFVRGFRQAWTTPLVHSDQRDGAKDDADKSEKGLGRFLNWGNFSAGAALVFLAIALYYTKAYASYKDRVENQASYIEELKKSQTEQKQKLDTVTAQNLKAAQDLSGVQTEAAVWKAKSQTAQQTIDALQIKAGAAASADSLQQQLNKLNAAQAELSAKAAGSNEKAIAAQTESDTYKTLWQHEKERADNSEKRAGLLNEENNKLQLEKAKSKSR
jgi:hypothetical protein